jgi:hypothetical protein
MKVSSLGIVVVAFLTTGTLVEIAKTKRRTTRSLFRAIAGRALRAAYTKNW